MNFFFGLLYHIFSVYITKEDELWAEFKWSYAKSYGNLAEDQHRFKIFQSNLHVIEEHNKRYTLGQENYFLKINQFTDLTDEEFDEIFTIHPQPDDEHAGTFVLPDGAVVPNSIDWRDKGVVLDIRDQGMCGSSWAFSAAAAVESQNAIKYNRKKCLSAIQLLDCAGDPYGYGNGYVNHAFTHIKNRGLSTEDSYPYKQRRGYCYNGTDSGVKVKSYVVLNRGEDVLKDAVGTIGPVSVIINSFPMRWYGGGIFDNKECGQKVRHAVVVVGYGREDGNDYWILKNSWGSKWGEKGYIRIRRNQSFLCGIGLNSSYPILA